MRKKDEDVPSHDQNGRSFLAEEVQAQRKDITELVKAVAGLQAVVKDMVDDSREERKSAKEQRDNIRDQLYAQRAEQAQLSMGLTDVQSKMTTISKTLGEHETERQQRVGAFTLATMSARVAWTLFGTAVASLAAAFAWIMKFAPGVHPTPPHP